MDPIIPSGKYILSVPTTAGTYYLGPLQDKPDTIGVLLEGSSPFTLVRDDTVDEYEILIGELCVDKMTDGSLCLKADDGRCEKWSIVSSGSETYMIKGGDDSCWSSPEFQAQRQAGFPVMDAEKCNCSSCGCDGTRNTCAACQTTSDGNTATILCTVCPPSCLAIKFVRV